MEAESASAVVCRDYQCQSCCATSWASLSLRRCLVLWRWFLIKLAAAEAGGRSRAASRFPRYYSKKPLCFLCIGSAAPLVLYVSLPATSFRLWFVLSPSEEYACPLGPCVVVTRGRSPATSGALRLAL